MTEFSAIKNQLYDFCLAYVRQRIRTAKESIAQAQKSANEETKNSAGDKYETGRAMMQIEIESGLSQLSEANKLEKAMMQIKAEEPMLQVRPGALAITDFGNYYLAIGAGQCIVDGNVYMTISPASPIGIKLMNLSAGDSFEMNGRKTKLKTIA